MQEQSSDKENRLPAEIRQTDEIAPAKGNCLHITQDSKGVDFGALLEQYGTYEANGVIISDVDEIWYVETIGGHHWIARRVPDDVYVVMPNQLGLDMLDLDDALGEQKDFICSADLREFINRYHLDLAQGDALNPRDAFGSHDDADHVYNTPRGWYMLRYFNPIGAHPSALIGELPRGVPQNLVPYITQTAAGIRECLSVFGDDYPTPDGTGVRDYIHVCDLASGHVAALNWMNGKTGVEIFNLGTGTGTSVLEVIAAFSKACGKELPYVIRERRAGDIAANWCDASKAERMMGWKAQYDIADMCRDSWNWQSHNPNGFADAE